MKFLNSWSIDLTKVPTYTLFKKPFTEDIDIHLAKLILEDTDHRLTSEIKSEFNKVVKVIDPKTNLLTSMYSPRYGLGRRYPDIPEPTLPNDKPNPLYGKIQSALITQPRLIKNTIFKYHDYIDIDQKKGHPTIILCNAKKNKMELPAYEEYLKNFDKHVDEIAKHYSVKGETPLDKKDIKLLFNRTIYGGGHDKWVLDIVEGKKDADDEEAYKREPKPMRNKNKPHPFYKRFYDETQQIIELVYSSNLELADKICKDIPDSSELLWKKKSRTMSYFCGIVENEITYQAYKYLQLQGLIWDRHLDWGLDGLTLPSFSEDEDVIKETIDEMNEYVRRNTKFPDVTFVVKDFDDSEILHNAIQKRNDMLIDEYNEDLEAPEPEIPEIKSFGDVAKEFEKKHCKIINKSVFVKQEGNEHIIMSKQQLSTSYEHLVYQKRKLQADSTYKVTNHQFIKDWAVCNERQRRYEDMGIYPKPSLCPKTHLNIWTPFKMATITNYTPNNEALEMILQHIKILCDHSEEVFDYFCKWIGQMLKHPEVKSGLCPTLISKQGAGKGTLLLLLSKMMGSEKVFETTTPSRDVWGDFNGQMTNSFLVNLNELSKKETLQSEGKIKGLITDASLTINNKGVNQFKITSYHRFIITTNSEEPITVRQDDRRNLIIRSSDEKRGDKEYFNQLYTYLQNQDVIKTCYEYFIHLEDIDKFNNLPVPSTEYQEDMQNNSMCPVQKWLHDYVRACVKKEGTIELLGARACTLFKDWCAVNNVEYQITSQAFALRLKRMGLKGIQKGRKTNKGNTMYYDIGTLKKELNVKDIVLYEEDTDEDDDEWVMDLAPPTKKSKKAIKKKK